MHIFPVNKATSEGRGGRVYISLLGTGPCIGYASNFDLIDFWRVVSWKLHKLRKEEGKQEGTQSEVAYRTINRHSMLHDQISVHDIEFHNFSGRVRTLNYYAGCSKKKLTILNGYDFFNIHGRWIKQKLAESWDFKILLHLSIYFSNIRLLATIEFYNQFSWFHLSYIPKDKNISSLFLVN